MYVTSKGSHQRPFFSNKVFKDVTRPDLSFMQVGALQAERARWQALEESQAQLEKEAAMWKSRYSQAAARSDELASDVARVQSELLATRLEASQQLRHSKNALTEKSY